MPSIDNVPGEILCDIFLIAIRDWRSIPEVFKAESDFKDCVTLIDLSRVCRRWREIAVTDPSLWSSLFIILLNETSAETLRKVTHFADVCLTRSKHLPLTLGVDISLKHSRSAHPLIFALATHEARWSRFSIQFLLAELFPSSEDGNDNIILKDPCGGSLQEFSHNVYPWIIHSGSEILQDLETLRLRIVGHTTRQEQIASDLTVPEITKSLSPAPHLKELDLMVNVCDWVSEYEQGPQILLLELQVLTSTPHLLPYLTCPALEKYTLVYVGDSYPRIILQDFVERSACPLHTLTFMDPLGLLYPPNAREYLIPRITSLVVVSPAEVLLYSVPPKGGEEFLDVLPSLEHLELHDIKSFSFDLVFNFITFRWDLGASSGKKGLIYISL